MIKMLLDINGKQQEISIIEAKRLHDELNTLFGNFVQEQNIITQRPKSTDSRASKEKSKRTESRIDTEPSGQIEKPKARDRYSNPRVEAAKERAAVRTSGCGSRR